MIHSSRLSLPFMVLVIVFGAFAGVSAIADEQSGPGSFAYKPPMRGAPSSRVGGGTRGIGTETTLTVLAPDHPGYTAQSQPSLYWFISGPVGMTLEVAINDRRSIEPIFERKLKSPASDQIQSLSLADYGVVLQPEVEYEWFVALVPDPNQRSNDVLSGAVIKRIGMQPELQARLAGSSAAEHARIYAENGLWYDAVQALSEQIETRPGNSAVRAQRAALLEQVGLRDAARFDKQTN